MAEHDVYFFTTVEQPYSDGRGPVPINTITVHARTLLHPDLPQPDGGMIYRCLTERPRRKNEIVPLSTLTWELDGGLLWSQVADWEAVTAALVRLVRAGRCDAMPAGLPQAMVIVLANGPTTTNHLYHPDGHVELHGPEHRERHLATLGEYLRSFLAQGPLWPGDGLVTPLRQPMTMPFAPYRSA